MADYGKTPSDALRLALSLEQEGLEMYGQAAQRAAHPVGKKIFLGLADDEKAHIRIIEEIARGMGFAAALEQAREGTAHERMRTIFTDAKETVSQRLAPSADEFEAIRIAMDFEQKGYKFYAQAAKDAAGPDRKALFEKLAGEENEHYRILESTRQYLDKTGEWFLWDEWGLIEGDMSSMGG